MTDAMQKSETSPTPTEKRYGPSRLGALDVIGVIIVNAVLVLIMVPSCGVSRAELLGIAIGVVLMDAVVVAVHLFARKYESIILTETHVCGYRFSRLGFTKPVWRLAVPEPLTISRNHIDKERSAKRTVLDRLTWRWSIWSKDGERLQVSRFMLGKAQIRELLEALGIEEER